jgi:hypothetical protein
VDDSICATPLDTNETMAGRENEHRVEVVVHVTILNKGSN